MILDNSKQRRVGVVLSYMSVVLSSVLSLVYTPILLQKLGREEYGVYTLVASTVSYLNLLSLGFGSAYVRFYSRYAAKEDRAGEAKLNGMYFLLYCFMGALALILGCIMAFNSHVIFKGLLPEEAALAEKLLLVLVVSTALAFPLSVFESIITAHERFIFQKIIIMMRRILNPCLVMLLLLLGFRSVALVVVNLVLTIASGATCAYYALFRIKAKFSFRNMQFRLIKEMGSYSFFVFLIMVSDQVSWNVDKFLLGVYKTSAAIAVYGVASQLNSYFLTFSDVVANVFTPKVHSMIAREDDNRRTTDLMIRVGRIQFYITMLIFMGFIFLGQPFIRLWAGAEYQESYWIGLILMGSITLPLMEALSAEILRAKGLHKQYSMIICGGTVLNLGISIPLCIRFGAMGCAIGTAVSMVAGSWIARNIYLKKKANIDVKRFILNMIGMLPSLLLPAVVGTAILLLAPIHGYLTLAAFALLFIAFYFASIWLFAMNADEKEMIRKPLRRIFRRN